MKNIIKPKKVLLLAATSDIGKHIAESFAKRGYELLLTSTNINSLRPITESLTKKYNVKIQEYQFDITDFSIHATFIKSLPEFPDIVFVVLVITRIRKKLSLISEKLLKL